MRAFVTPEDLTSLIEETYGPGRKLRELTRLTGGSTKGVYRITLDDDSTVLLYRWAADENFWPASSDLDVGPFVPDSGRDGFVRCHAQLRTLGVRVPKIVRMGADRALVEDIRGGTLEALLDSDPPAGRAVLTRLGETLRTMHTHTTSSFPYPGETPEGFAHQRGLRSLAEAAARDPRIGALEKELQDALSRRFEAVKPRQEYALIHGELGPDHVMVGPAGEPVLIDIEATMFFDVEWEHAFLELRFGPLYPQLDPVPLDQDRLSFYRLVMYLSLVAGPLLMIDGGDFPYPEGMRAIAEDNIRRTLAELPTASS